MSCIFLCKTCNPEDEKVFTPVRYQLFVEHLVGYEHCRKSMEKYGRFLKNPQPLDDQRYVIVGIRNRMTKDELLDLAFWLCEYGVLTDFLYMGKYGFCSVVLHGVGDKWGLGNTSGLQRLESFEKVTEYGGRAVKIYPRTRMGNYEWDKIFSGDLVRDLDLQTKAAKAESTEPQPQREEKQRNVKPQPRDLGTKGQGKPPTAPFHAKELPKDNFNKYETTRNGRRLKLDMKGKENLGSTEEESKVVSKDSAQQQRIGKVGKGKKSMLKDEKTSSFDTAAKVLPPPPPLMPVKPVVVVVPPKDVPVMSDNQGFQRRGGKRGISRVILPTSVKDRINETNAVTPAEGEGCQGKKEDVLVPKSADEDSQKTFQTFTLDKAGPSENKDDSKEMLDAVEALIEMEKKINSSKVQENKGGAPGPLGEVEDHENLANEVDSGSSQPENLDTSSHDESKVEVVAVSPLGPHPHRHLLADVEEVALQGEVGDLQGAAGAADGGIGTNEKGDVLVQEICSSASTRGDSPDDFRNVTLNITVPTESMDDIKGNEVNSSFKVPDISSGPISSYDSADAQISEDTAEGPGDIESKVMTVTEPPPRPRLLADDEEVALQGEVGDFQDAAGAADGGNGTNEKGEVLVQEICSSACASTRGDSPDDFRKVTLDKSVPTESKDDIKGNEVNSLFKVPDISSGPISSYDSSEAQISEDTADGPGDHESKVVTVAGSPPCRRLLADDEEVALQGEEGDLQDAARAADGVGGNGTNENPVETEEDFMKYALYWHRF